MIRYIKQLFEKESKKDISRKSCPFRKNQTCWGDMCVFFRNEDEDCAFNGLHAIKDIAAALKQGKE